MSGKRITARVISHDPDFALFGLAAAFVAFGFAFYTDQIWEDFFITFRHSQNLCEGKGLVYNEGERVHGFTSPLGVLLPAFCYAVTGSHSYVPALWLFRVMSALAFVVAGILLLRCLPQDSHRRLQRFFFGALYLITLKAVMFSMNGMETAFVLLLFAWGLSLSQQEWPQHWLANGACWAGLMWVRPDGLVIIGILAFVNLAYTQGDRKAALLALLKSGLVCALLYMPWFGWAWYYYGSPIPQTVRAKTGMGSSSMPEGPHELAAKVFLPTYFDLNPDNWYPGMSAFAMLLGVFCATYWLFPVNDKWGRTASLCFASLTLYFTAVQRVFHTYIFPWYMAPAEMLGAIVLTRGALGIASLVRQWLPYARAIAIFSLCVISSERAVLFALTLWQTKVHQQEVEMGNRARIGRWLKSQIRSADTVYLEPVGYIGYFSGAKIRDWPGLVSPEVVRLRREKHLHFASVAQELRPDWLVLRAGEVVWLETWLSEPAFLSKNYALAEVFDVVPNLNHYRYIPGRNYVLKDALYAVYQKKAP